MPLYPQVWRDRGHGGGWDREGARGGGKGLGIPIHRPTIAMGLQWAFWCPAGGLQGLGALTTFPGQAGLTRAFTRLAGSWRCGPGRLPRLGATPASSWSRGTAARGCGERPGPGGLCRPAQWPGTGDRASGPGWDEGPLSLPPQMVGSRPSVWPPGRVWTGASGLLLRGQALLPGARQGQGAPGWNWSSATYRACATLNGPPELSVLWCPHL